MSKSFHTEIVLNDLHIPKQNKKSVSCVLKVIKSLKPNGITLNGDIGDWATFSRHDRFSPPKCHWKDEQFYLASEPHYKALNNFLDTIDKYIPKAVKTWCMGNHEIWVDDFISESSRTRKQLFDINERLRLKERGYSVHPYGKIVTNGKLRLTHGLYTVEHHAKKHVEAMGTSVLYGHTHDIQEHSKVTPENISHMGWSNGCLCDMNPDYLRGKPQRWNHGFSIVYRWPNGDFQVDIIRIHAGKCIVHGKEFVG